MILMNQLSIIVRYCHIFSERRLKEHEIGFPEQIVLMYVAKYKNINQEAIARYYVVDKGAIAKTVGKLETKGYIERHQNPENKRENLLSLTECGHKVIGTMSGIFGDWNERLYEGISKEEKEMVERITKRMAENAVRAISEDESKNQ